MIRDGIAYWPGSHRQGVIHLFSPDETRSMLESAGWEVLALRPADLLVSLIDHHFVEQEMNRGGEPLDDALMLKWIETEESLRDEPTLLGCGSEVQFVARKNT